MINRFFVEKRPGFDVEAKGMLHDLTQNLGIEGLEGIRILNRYDVEGMEAADLDAAKRMIFAEPNADYIYEEAFPIARGWRAFAMEYLPGQYDQRADSAMQCVQLLTQKEQPVITTAKVVVVQGAITEEAFPKIVNYCINPVESRQASMEKPESLQMERVVPDDVARVRGFIGMTEEETDAYRKQGGFSMSLEDMLFCQGYFRDTEHRDPTITELRAIDTYWSDHCRHTTFASILQQIEVQDGPYSDAILDGLSTYLKTREAVYGSNTARPMTLMDMATVGAKQIKKQGGLQDLDESEEINACSIKVDIQVDGETQPWLLQFKNETHNHPTEIEPFGGAATCLGGAIRDILAGRGYVHQSMRITGSANPNTPFEQTLPGKLSQRKITTGAAAGFSSYGNQIGIATGQVTELYDPGYVAKRMEIGAVVGACPEENVIRLTPEPGDVVILLGGRTGRDGVGGATGSSKSHDASSLENCGAEVQKGNPPTERKIQRLLRNPEASRMIVRCNDFGAGGVSVAIGEIAEGIRVNLDTVPRKYDGLDGSELALSESQERMAMVVRAQDADRFIALAQAENLEATAVAVVTDDRRMTMTWRGDTIIDISRDFLDTNGTTQTTRASIASPQGACYRDELPELPADLRAAWLQNLSRLEVCAQKGLVERFDSTIGANTVLMPFAGKYQLTPEEAMVAKFPVLKGETDDASAMAYGFMPGLSRWSPFHAGAFSVVEALAKLAAVGADPLRARLSFQEYFEKLEKNPEKWGKPAAALLGALSAQLAFGVPAIGGKDSMSGTFEDISVPPTIVCFAISPTKAGVTKSAALQQAGLALVHVTMPTDSISGMPKWDAVKETLARVHRVPFAAASVVREGGVAAAVTRMCMGNRVGAKLTCADRALLFAPRCGDMVLAMNKEDMAKLEGLEYTLLGETGGNAICVGDTVLPFDEVQAAWMGTLESVFPTKAKFQPLMLEEMPLYTARAAKSKLTIAKPRVLIPVFPGTNCEYDTARAFERAGAVADTVIVNNLSTSAIEETIERLEKGLKNAQILMIPGGFSGGDEPDGSGKFIATTFRNPRLAQAVTDLLEKRDGLVLGICNGFQALIKLGLVPYGKICDIQETDPTLTFNSLGRHVSCMVNTRVASVKSPWLMNCQAGDVHSIAVSHGEGRFAADEATLRALFANGQIATQYVDLAGNPTDDIAWNPNGSACAVEGITSPDGRVLGKMGHSERMGSNIAKNVPGEKDQKLFASGVAYFG